MADGIMIFILLQKRASSNGWLADARVGGVFYSAEHRKPKKAVKLLLKSIEQQGYLDL